MRPLSIFAAVSLLALAPGCARQINDQEILVGEFASMTGTTAQWGISSHNGFTLGFDEVNASGGVLGKKIKLLTEDDQSRPEEAATAVTKLITRDNVKAIVGEVASSRSLAAAPICQANKIPMISHASTNPDVTRKGDYIFRTCFIDPFQGAVLAKFAANSLKVKRVAVLKDVRNDYSVGLTKVFIERFKELGGAIVAEQAYSEGDSDFKAQLTALKASNPDLIFLPGYYAEAALIAKQARDLRLTQPILGGDGWDSEKLVEIGGLAMNNTFYSNHYTADDTSAAVQSFVKKYRERFGATPDAMAALAYDASRILAAAFTRAGTTQGDKLRDAIALTKDFRGVAGMVTIGADRNASKSAVIIAVQDRKLIYKETIAP